jgi:TolB-like protein
MSSLLPGYEYDIFVSYRHNDNRSGWVNEFVEALQEELAATIKEPLSIYFDKNPHDGLLETHHVDKSLEGKLKCLIFIPIISQTYCDPNSFAWKHEFCAFNKLAMEDALGRDIKLGNGNVASRILPVKIHDLDAEDKHVIESEIAGVLRAIEFIYKEPGVNRPLKPTDSKSENRNQTDYTNQVNKVANAVKEIVGALKPRQQSLTGKLDQKTSPPTTNKRTVAAFLAIGAVLLAVASYFLYPRFVETPAAEKLEKSIAVLPFADMSPNKDQEYLGDGIAEEILNLLARVKDLKVIGRTSSFSYKGKGTDLKTIGKELGVSTILEGSVRKDGNKIRITAQFINAQDGTHLWSESYDRELKDVFQIQDELAKNISTSLLTTFEDPVSEANRREGPANNEAYNLYLLGKYHFSSDTDSDVDRKAKLYEAIKFYKQSIKLDSTFASSYADLAQTYIFYGFFFGDQEIRNVYDSAELNARKALTLDNRNVQAYIDMALVKRNRDWDWEASRGYYQRALALAPNNGYTFGLYSMLLSAINEIDSASYYSKKAVFLDPNSDGALFYAMRTAYYDRQFNEAFSLSKRIHAIGRKDFIVDILFHVNKDRSVSELIGNSELDEPVKMELLNYYRREGWDALMRKLYTTYFDKIIAAKDVVLIHGAPKDVVFEKLNAGADKRVGEMVYLLISPVYDPIRSDPRFDQLLKRMGLDKYK